MVNYAPYPAQYIEQVYEYFHKQHALKFEGTTDPFEVEEWLKNVEPILKHMNLVIGTRVEEFSSLKQGNLKVAEYARQFDRPAKFAPELVPTDYLRVTKFTKGLKSKIGLGVKLANPGTTSYADVLETAIEDERLQENVSKEEQVKAKHQPPPDLLQLLSISEWTWEDIATDFVTALPKISKQHDSAWVVVERLTTSAHFLPVKTTYIAKQYAYIYVREIAVREAQDAVELIKERMLVAQSRLKSYADAK
ncbi:uncharacterized protein LOC133832787 [Humulus lupulus]|uniref:uncharacterized protein LOC133832787 n=1 Tax=Humulus lupulus TaxID=3486 RepID=UPI002B413F98|nr:uncharacterized protein LOC133832787 [Humulus lupulus]